MAFNLREVVRDQFWLMPPSVWGWCQKATRLFRWKPKGGLTTPDGLIVWYQPDSSTIGAELLI